MVYLLNEKLYNKSYSIGMFRERRNCLQCNTNKTMESKISYI